jgi:hypothetical protein
MQTFSVIVRFVNNTTWETRMVGRSAFGTRRAALRLAKIAKPWAGTPTQVQVQLVSK